MICEVCKSDNPYQEFCEECLHRYLQQEQEELDALAQWQIQMEEEE